MSSIKIKNLSFAFNNNYIFKDLSLEFNYSKAYSISGNSGSGKTTFLKVLSGIHKKFEGSITFPKSSKLSFIFQDDIFIDCISALKNVELVLSKNSLMSAKEYLSAVGLSGFENYPPSKLSGGMKRKLSIATALAFNPDIFIMDEPFRGIDSPSKLSLIKLLKDIKLEKIIIFSTHDKSEKEHLSDLDIYF